MAISDESFKLFPFVLMYDDETVLDAVIAFRDGKAQNFWQLVVDLGGGGYAVTTFSEISGKVAEGKKTFLDKKLGALVGDVLIRIDVVAEQSTSDTAAVESEARETGSKMVAVVDRGELVGVFRPGGPMRDGGLFGPELVKLAGQYADLPTTGLVSRRRQEAIAARKRKSQ